jgi:glutamate decarboxylase
MPEREMPPQVAARMIKDGQSYVHPSISPDSNCFIDLSLDGTPSLNLATFVTSFMVWPFPGFTDISLNRD